MDTLSSEMESDVNQEESQDLSHPEHKDETKPKTPMEHWLRRQFPQFPLSGVLAALSELQKGSPVPYLAFFNKHLTKGMTTDDLFSLIDAKSEWEDIARKQAHILQEIQALQKLTPELKQQVDRCNDLDRLEDLYAPYKLRKQTLAAQAKEFGLAPLAQYLWEKGHAQESAEIPGATLDEKAQGFAKAESKFPDAIAVLKGVQDILIERISEDAELRALVRATVLRRSKLRSGKGPKAKAGSKYGKFFEYQEPIGSLKKSNAAHRYLAIRKGWMEDELVVSFERPDEGLLLEKFEQFACSVPDSIGAELLVQAGRLALKGNVYTVMENEAHRRLKESAEEHVINVLCENFRRKLLRPGIGRKQLLGIEPGTADGSCSLALLDVEGKPLIHFQINLKESGDTVKTDFLQTLEKTPIEAIAVAHGPSSKQVRDWFKNVLTEAGKQIPIITIHEHSANIYASSPSAKEEFPSLDLSMRRAIFVARYLQDPLLVLSRLEPKYLSLGEFQHEVNASRLKIRLQRTLESCVNFVGVDPNYAPLHLLSNVSGFNKEIAQGILDFRSNKSSFGQRKDLNQISSIEKIFEFSSGFLRFQKSQESLDQTFIHPKFYDAVKNFLSKNGAPLDQSISPEISTLMETAEELTSQIDKENLQNIRYELENLGLDPRGSFQFIDFDSSTKSIKDLKRDVAYRGIITNLTSFGAFVDVGIDQDGLVHISELSDLQSKNPFQNLFPGDEITVWVSNLNEEKKQISFSTRDPSFKPRGERGPRGDRPQSGERRRRPPMRPRNAEGTGATTEQQPGGAAENGEQRGFRDRPRHDKRRPAREGEARSFRGPKPGGDAQGSENSGSNRDARGNAGGGRNDRGDRGPRPPLKPKKPQRDSKTGAIIKMDDMTKDSKIGMKLPTKTKPHTFNPFANLANILKEKQGKSEE